mgnify:CR=1 FL=1
MILQALTKCYEDLLKKGVVPKQGWCQAKVNFAINLDVDGNIKSVVPLEDFDAKKKIFPPIIKDVPEQGVRSSGISPQFLCDNSSYILGVDNSGKPNRTAECFTASKNLHLKILMNVDNECANAVKAFFSKWNPEILKNIVPKAIYDYLINKGTIVFRYNGKYVHEDYMVQCAWDEYYSSNIYDKKGQCLVTGKYTNLRRLHPMIKGVWGSQSSGASMVSFNAPAYESYGQSGNTGLNAPVGDYAAFAYTTALNYMLRQKNYTAHIGGTTVVYWADSVEEDYNDVFESLFENNGSNMSQQELKSIVKNIADGTSININGSELKYNNRFYVLGLVPNAARISISFFMVYTFGNVLKNLIQNYNDLNIIKPSFVKFDYLPLRSLLLETINKNSKDKKAPESLTAALVKSVLNGSMYPAALLQNVIRRLHIEKGKLIEPGNKNTDKTFEQDGNYIKAAIIKAYLNRKLRLRGATKYLKEEFTVSINENSKNKPYNLGRLFAVYEHIQDAASGKAVNATIKDRYFSSAMSTPAKVFPLLAKLAAIHLEKISKEGDRIYLEKQITEIINLLDEENGLFFPRQLSLEEQGNFYVGYYHQVQKRYTKKEAEK